MVRGKAGAGGMDTLERSERETKLAKVQPHVSFIFKFLLAFCWPENEIHTVHGGLQSPGNSTSSFATSCYFNSLNIPRFSPPFHMSQPLPGKPSSLPHHIMIPQKFPLFLRGWGISTSRRDLAALTTIIPLAPGTSIQSPFKWLLN